MPTQGEFYQRDRDRHPPAYAKEYKTSVARSPQYSLISLQNSVSEITGPVFGHNDIDPMDRDLINILRAKNVCIFYGQKQAVNNVDFEVQRGSGAGAVPSGTRLLRLVSALSVCGKK